MKVEKMSVVLTEGFRVMDEEEKKQLNFYGEAADLCLKDEEKHILMCMASKKVNPLAILIINEKDLIRQTEKVMAGAMKPYGYGFKEYLSRDIGGRKAQGYLYDYLAEDIEMSGETFCLKKDKAIYYIYAYFRRSLEDESLKAIDVLLDQISWDQ